VTGARDQVARLLALVPYIQAREEVSVQQAATDFGVPPAQILKDLNVLWFCGLPGLGMGDLIEVDMEALEGDGVIKVSNADYLRRPLRLDSSEASALLVALRALRETGDETVRPVVDRTLAKLEAAAGDGAALAAQVDVRLSPREAEVGRLRTILEDAIVSGVQVRLDYYAPTRDAQTQRVVDPLRVFTAEGHGYLDAWCHLAQGQRLFRIDRISSADVLDSTAEAHEVEPRDPADGVFQGSADDVVATVLLRPQARWVAEYYPVVSTEEAADGALRVRLRVADPVWLRRLLLRLGEYADVEEPAALADDVRRAASAALTLYR